jgi:hypothetical protein
MNMTGIGRYTTDTSAMDLIEFARTLQADKERQIEEAGRRRRLQADPVPTAPAPTSTTPSAPTPPGAPAGEGPSWPGQRRIARPSVR